MPQELRDSLISYLPHTFTYGSTTCSGEDSPADKDKGDDAAATETDAVTPERICRMAAALASGLCADGLGDGNIDGNGSNEENNSDMKVTNNCLSVGLEEDEASITDHNVSAGDPEEQSAKLFAAVKVVLASESATLLESVRLAFLAIEPMDKTLGSVSDGRKFKSLLARWISRPTAKEDKGSGEGHFIERGTVVTMNVKLAAGKNSLVSVR